MTTETIFSQAQSFIVISPIPNNAYEQVVLEDTPSNFWILNDTGTTAIDSIGGIDGALQSGVSFTSGGLLGQKAAFFNNSGSARILMGTSLPIYQFAYTLEIWIKTTNSFGDTGLLGRWDGNGAFLFWANDSALQVVHGGSSRPQYNGNLRDGTWHHIVGTYDSLLVSNQAKLYIDGTLISEVGVSAPGNPGGIPFEIGGYNGNGKALGGLLNYAAYYGKALNATQISNHFNATIPKQFGQAQAFIITQLPTAQAQAFIYGQFFIYSQANTKLIGTTERFGLSRAVVYVNIISNTESPSGNILVVTGTAETILAGCDLTISESLLVKISWNIWTSENRNGVHKYGILRIRRTDLSGEVLFSKSWETFNDNSDGHIDNWVGTSTVIGLDSHFVLTFQSTAGTNDVLTYSDTRNFSIEEFIPPPLDVYSSFILNDGPTNYYPLNDNGSDLIAHALIGNDGTYNSSGITYNIPIPLSTYTGITTASTYMNTNSNDVTDNFSVESWYKVNTTILIGGESTGGVYSADGGYGDGHPNYLWFPDQRGGNRGLGISVGTNGVVVAAHGDGNLYVLAAYSGTIAAESWHHVVVTVTDRQPSIYVDGVLVRTGLTNTQTLYRPTRLLGGGSYSPFMGTTAAAALYSVVLTEIQIYNHYNAGIPRVFGQAQAFLFIFPVAYAQAAAFIGGQLYVHAQVQSKLIGIVPQPALAQAYIIVLDVSKNAQAKALIQPLNGILLFTNGIWSVESRPGQPNYTDPLVALNLTAAFVADETGTWQFRATVDDGLQFYINNTLVINMNIGAGVVGTIPLVSGQVYTFNANFWVQSDPDYLSIEYKRPSDTEWWFLTDNDPPWIPGLGQRYAHAQATIKTTYPNIITGVSGFTRVRPISDIDVSPAGMVYSSGTTGWNLVNEEVLDLDTWYIAGFPEGYIVHQFSVPEVPPYAGYNIDSVTVTIYAICSAPSFGGDIQVRNPETGLRYTVLSGGQGWNGYYSVTLTTRPWDNQPWTLDDINNLQIGDTENYNYNGYQGFTVRQLYADINWSYTSTNPFAQAQAEILPAPYQYSFAQANTLIENITNVQAQVQAYISPAFNQPNFAQAQTKLISFNYPQHAQSQAQIKTFGVNQFAQALAFIPNPTARAQAQSWIKQTYPFTSLDTNYALLSLGASATDSTGQPSTPNNTIDGNDYGLSWTLPNSLDQSLTIDLGQSRTVNYYRILPLRYDCTISLQYSDNNTNWYDAITGIQFSVDFFGGIDTSRVVTGEIGPITARYWRLLVTDSGSFNGTSILTVELGIATTKGGTFAQAQAFLGNMSVAQAQTYISPGYGMTYGLAKAQIMATLYGIALSRTYIIPPTVIAQANADIVNRYNIYGLSNAWIIPPTVVAQVQATIKAYDINNFAQSNADILTIGINYGQASSFITKPAGHGLALATIETSRNWMRGQAQAFLEGTYSYAQVQAIIKNPMAIGQAKADIMRTFQRYAQVQAFIRQVKGYGQANSDIKAVDQNTGQAQALLNQAFGLGQSQTSILQIYVAHAQGNARVKNIATNYSNPYAQAQAVIYIRYYVSAQSMAWIAVQNNVFAQALAFIGNFRIAQAQARIYAFDYPRHAQVQGYIAANITIALKPSSEYHTYLVRYNDYDLPGYAQEESYDSVQNIMEHSAVSIDGSMSEYIGLTNKTITLRMRTWEPTYLQVKEKVTKAATMLRSFKGFAKLYIQQPDAYFLALVKSITTEKTVKESSRILDYNITFETKPWVISKTVYEVSGTGLVDTGNRAITDGGWTPTKILVSGTDVEITAYTETGNPAGFISITGTCTNLLIDSENFTATENGVNKNGIINTKNYAIYVGPGKTFFQINGATSCVIQYQNRWYLAGTSKKL